MIDCIPRLRGKEYPAQVAGEYPELGIRERPDLKLRELQGSGTGNAGIELGRNTKDLVKGIP